MRRIKMGENIENRDSLRYYAKILDVSGGNLLKRSDFREHLAG